MQFQKISIPPSPRRALLLQTPSPLEFPFKGLRTDPPPPLPPPGTSVIFQFGWVSSGKNISVQNVVAVYNTQIQPWKREYFIQRSFKRKHRLSRFLFLWVGFFTKVQDKIKNSDHQRLFVKKKNDVSKKGIFFNHRHRNDPQYHAGFQTCRVIITRLVIN